MSYKNVLITGGAGFIGSNLANKLVELGYNVTVLDSLSIQIHGEEPNNSYLYGSLNKDVKFINGDVTNVEDWEIALDNIEIVVHFAAETGTGQSMYNIQRYVDVNITGTSILLDYLVNKNNKIKKVIVASSRAIYGEGKYHSKQFGVVYPTHRTDVQLSNHKFDVSYLDDNRLTVLATDEDSKLHPSSIYGITKLNQEQMVMAVCKSVSIPCVAFRYQNVYGPGQSLSNPYTGIISIFSNLLLQGKNINVFEDGLESRDFVYIDDVVYATILGIKRSEADFQVFNVGSGVMTSILKLAKLLISELSPTSSYTISNQYRLGDIRHNFADLTKIKKLLDFDPKINFETGISFYCDWVRKQEYIQGNYEQSILELKSRGLLKS